MSAEERERLNHERGYDKFKQEKCELAPRHLNAKRCEKLMNP